MVSDFLVQHPSSPFFTLNDNEWKNAIKEYPSLLDDPECDYLKNSCTGSMIPGIDGYFDNDSVLSQFERMFILIQFKMDYNEPINHDFEFVVDNALKHFNESNN